MNYYSKYPGDYLRDTPHLSLAEHGAYNLLLDYYYSRGGQALPRERRIIYRMLRADTPGERQAVDAVLEEFWFETADGWENHKANTVMEKVRAIQEKRRKAAQVRWEKERRAAAEVEADGDGMQVHMQMHPECMSNQNQNQSQNQSQNQKKEDAARARETPLPSDQPDSAFLDMRPFQDAYPKRAGSQPWRQAAAMAQTRIREGHAMAVLIEGARRYRLYCEASGEVGTKFVMQARTFLGPELHFLEPWDPPAEPRKRTRAEEAAEHNLAAFEAMQERRQASGYERAGRVRQGDLHGGNAERPQIASNGG